MIITVIYSSLSSSKRHIAASLVGAMETLSEVFLCLADVKTIGGFSSIKNCFNPLRLDISAAFDMVDHNLLLERLSVEFGVTGAARDWIASYLRSRSFFVRNRHLAFVHRMPASLMDQCSVRYFLQCMSPHRSSHREF